jgi:cytoskeleton protein RodZ
VLQERRSGLLKSRSTLPTDTPTDPPAAARAGAELRAARQRLGVSLHDVAVLLRIRLPYLEALENGDIAALPGNAYALAFVRTYATSLGLDAEEMVRRFKSESAGFERRTKLVFPIPMPERGLPAGAVALLGIVLAVGAYAGWYRLSGEGRLPAETETAIPERLASLAEQAIPLPAAPIADAVAAVTPRIVLDEPGSAENVAEPAPPVMAISPTSAAAAGVPARLADAGPGAGADGSRIVLRANADSWLMVKDRAGPVLLNRTLKAGETWQVPPRPDLLLTTGNAGGTDVIVDGAAIPPLGGSGAVRRDLLLDPDQIKDGKMVAAVVAPLASTRPRQ